MAATVMYDGSTDFFYDYVNESDIVDEVCDKKKVLHFGAIFNPVFFSIVTVLSLFGNILVIVILAKYENLKSLTNAFMLNLAMSDLIFTVGLPFWAYYNMYKWTLGDTACKIVCFVFYVGYYSSGILLILMTIHRYVAVISPLSEIVYSKGFNSILASVVIWVVSTLAATPALLFSKALNNTYCGYKDTYWKVWGMYQQNILFLVTFLIFIFCYAQILCRLLRPPVQRRRNKTVKLIFILVVIYFVGWAPYNIVVFLRSLSFEQPTSVKSNIVVSNRCQNYSKPLDYAFYISRLVAFSHCCLNPVFYVFVGVKFKNHLKKILKSWGQRSNSLRRNSRNSRFTTISLTSGEEFSMRMTSSH